MWDKWNYFSIACSTDKPSVKVPAPFGTCRFGKEVARIMSRWQQQNQQILSENLRKLGDLQVKEVGLFSYSTQIFLSITLHIWARIRSKNFTYWWRRSSLEVQKNLMFWGILSFYDWFLGAAGWPGLAGAAALGRSVGLENCCPFYFLENNCWSPNWCQWYWNIWIYFCGTSKTEDKQKWRKTVT